MDGIDDVVGALLGCVLRPAAGVSSAHARHLPHPRLGSDRAHVLQARPTMPPAPLSPPCPSPQNREDLP